MLDVEGGIYNGVQTGNIVYKTDRVHSLHFMARRNAYAMESDKQNGPQVRTYSKLE